MRRLILRWFESNLAHQTQRGTCKGISLCDITAIFVIIGIIESRTGVISPAIITDKSRYSHSKAKFSTGAIWIVVYESKWHRDNSIERSEFFMSIMIKAVNYNKPCTLVKCPPGLFLFDGTLGFKTEYDMLIDPFEETPQAFVLASGEVFWGGARNHEERRNLIVQPLDYYVIT